MTKFLIRRPIAVGVGAVLSLFATTFIALPSHAATAPGMATEVKTETASTETAGASFTEKIPDSLVTFEMVAIPGGNVTLVDVDGKEKTTEIKPFWIGQTEVTWDAFDIYAFRLDLSEADEAAGVDAQSRPSKPYGAPDRGFGHQGYPAIAMTVHSAQEYCNWLSKKTGHKYRLPTLAEWQYACRTTSQATEPALEERAWFWDNAEDTTHPVGKKAANAWALHDMLGNVAEWAIGLEGTPVACGGSYDDTDKKVSCEAREIQVPAWNMTDPQRPKSRWWLADAPFIGFRVVREMDTDANAEVTATDVTADKITETPGN